MKRTGGESGGGVDSVVGVGDVGLGDLASATIGLKENAVNGNLARLGEHCGAEKSQKTAQNTRENGRNRTFK